MFSVIVPVYNGEKFVENAIACVLEQTFSDWELVIVNDGSRDGTQEILDKYKNNPKIKIISKENGGVSEARNTAMQNASGEYFAFLDCDDLWLPNHLETLNEMIQKYPDGGTFATLTNVRLPNGDFVSNVGYFDDRADSEKEIFYIENFMAEYDRDKRAKTHFPTSACVSKIAAEKVGGFKKGCKIGEDLAFFLLAGIYFPVVLSRKITTIYEKGNSTATKDVSFDPDWYFFDDVKRVYDDDAVAEETKESTRRVMQWFSMRRARHYMIDGRKKEARRSYKEIGKNPSLRKDKIITFILLFMPVKVVQRVFSVRWRTKA